MTNLFDIHGKVALVTGGTRGIGLMIAKGFVQSGVKTYVTSRKVEACEAAARSLSEYGQVIAIPADLSDRQQLRTLAETICAREPALHILVNNAGTAWGAPFDTFPEDGWEKVMNLNLGAIFFLTQALIKPLEAGATSNDPARVINIGSVDGLSAPSFQNFPYAAAKAGLHHLTRHLALHLASRNVNVNAIAPGYFATKMMDWLLDKNGEEILATVPRGRVGNQDDAAGLAIFLSSIASAFITGAVIPLDGGYSTTR